MSDSALRDSLDFVRTEVHSLRAQWVATWTRRSGSWTSNSRPDWASSTPKVNAPSTSASGGGSGSAMYRVLAEHKAVRARRPQRDHPENAVPRCRATAPNQLWSWDITKLPGPARSFFSLYVVLDVFSRYVVAWLLARRESAYLATRLIEQAIVSAGVDGDQLTIHADRGAPMTSKSLAQMLADLGVERSQSRPRVSNDNPFSEAHFKTMKYCTTYPGRFAGIEPARTWCSSFIEWYNDEHRHEGIGLFTPADVHFGRHLELDRVRQRALDAAYASHPERFVKGPPTSPSVPSEVWINRPADRGPSPSRGGSGGPGGEGPRLPLVAAQEAPVDTTVIDRRETRSRRPKVALLS